MAKSVQDTTIVNAFVATAAKGDWDKSRQVAARPKGAQLPGGLVGVLCQIISMKIAMTQKTADRPASPYCDLHFVVLSPAEFEGLQLHKKWYFGGNQYKTAEEQNDEFASDFQLLGGATKTLALKQIPAAVAAHGESGTVFKINTRTGKSDSGNDWLSYQIQGTAEYTPDDSVVVEEMEPEPEPEPVSTPAPAPARKAPARKAPAPAVEPEPEPEPEVEEPEVSADGAWEPEVGQAYYMMLKGDKRYVVIATVDSAKQQVVVEDDETKTKYRIGYDKLLGE